MSFRSVARESTFRLLDGGGSPFTGLFYNSVSVSIRKEGGVFAAKTLTENDWVELGAGYYAIKWSADDMDTLGSFRYRITGEGLVEHSEEFVIAPQPLSFAVSADTCVVTGGVAQIMGGPVRQEVLVFRPLTVPTYVGGTSLLSAGAVRSVTDAFGNFSVALLRGAKVLVEVERAGIKYKIDVPDAATANLIDLLPELT